MHIWNAYNQPISGRPCCRQDPDNSLKCRLQD
jgi:hypothetical protein